MIKHYFRKGMRKMIFKKTGSDIALDIFIYFILILLFIITFYPFWSVVIMSFNDATDTIRGNLFFLPRVPTIQSYRIVLREKEFISSFGVTFLRTAIGTPLALLTTTMAAFVLSRETLPGRKFISLAYIFTMYFGGGLIPYYMILRMFNLIDSFAVYIFPNLVDVFNIMLILSYIRELPKELEEAATIDGAGYFTVYARIIMPICTPILATIGLFIAIGHWNSWFDSYAFTYNPKLKTLQAYLVKILNQYTTGGMVSASQALADSNKRNPVSSDSIRMATTVVATVPILLAYPFVQKYFVKGILIGSVKA